MPSVEFAGEQFVIADKVGLMPLMRFARVAQSGVDSNDLQGLVVMYDLIQQCLADAEWERFEAHATKVRADGDDLMAFVAKVMASIAERPTVQPSDSSAGPSVTPVSSVPAPVNTAMDALSGRPDLQLAIVRRAEMLASA